MPFVFSHVEYCDIILCMDFAMPMHVLLQKNTKGVFLIEGFCLEVYLREFTRHCVILVLFQVYLCSLKGRWYERLTHERTFFRWFRERSPRLSTRRMASRIGVSRMQVWRTLHEEDLYPQGTTSGTSRPCSAYGFLPLDKSSSRTVKRHFIP